MNKGQANHPSTQLTNGLLIAFEGIDGSGKTTMAHRTVQFLSDEGFKAHYLREPTDGPHGRRLRQMMTQPGPRDPQAEFDLFIKDRQQDVEQNINPLLNSGAILCIDRYYISSMAYQGALGLDVNFIQQTNEKFAPRPHLILHFDIPVEIALQRIEKSRLQGANNFEQEDNLRRVADIFQKMKFPELRRIDANRPPDEVFDQITRIILPLVKQPA